MLFCQFPMNGEATLKIETVTCFPMVPCDTFAILNQIATSTCLVLYLTGFQIIANFFKDMHDILNEAYAMLPEVNIPKNPVRVLWRLWEKHGGK